jgi:hypothetical protein
MMDDAGGGLRGLRAAPTAELAEVLGRRYGIDAGRVGSQAAHARHAAGGRVERFFARLLSRHSLQ